MMDPETQTLETLAKEIATKGGEHDRVTQLLAKGMNDAFGQMAKIAEDSLALLKGRAAPAAPKEEPASEGSDNAEGKGEGEDEDDKGEEGEDAPGYQDMQLAVPDGALDLADPTKALDVTKFIFDTGACVRDIARASNAQAAVIITFGERMEKAVAKIEAQDSLIATLIDQNIALGKLVADSNGASASILGPLAKAVADTRELLQNIPGPGITPLRFPRKEVPAPDAAYIGGTRERELQVLAKAERLEKIDTDQLNYFKRTRRFSALDAEHAQIRATLDALALT